MSMDISVHTTSEFVNRELEFIPKITTTDDVTYPSLKFNIKENGMVNQELRIYPSFKQILEIHNTLSKFIQENSDLFE